MPLKLRRGTNAEIITITPAEGELIYSTDTKKIYVGDGITQGGIDVTGAASLFGPLSGNLDINHYNITGIGNVEVNGIISNGPLSLNSNYISSSSGYVSQGLGNHIGILELSTPTNLLQINRYWSDPNEPIEIQTGITNSFTSLMSDRRSSRGSVGIPTATIPGDNIALERFWGHDGFNYLPTSAIWHGVDPNGTVSPGFVPGAIALITEGIGGPHVVSVDSKGNLGIGVYPELVQEKLHVEGNALISGTLIAGAVRGSIFADNSSVLIDSIYGNMYANNLSVTGILNCGETVQKSPNGYLDISSRYGITSGLTSLMTGNYASRGSLVSPSSLHTGDSISFIRNFGHDGSNYVFSSGIQFGLDPSISSSIAPSTGKMPGAIGFIVVDENNIQNYVSIDSAGQVGIGTFPNPTTEALDVNGNGKFSGSITTTSIQQNLSSGVDATKLYGISDGVNCLVTSNYASRGSLPSPSSLYLGDSISAIRNYGFDGTNYILSSAIDFVLDGSYTPSTGYMPGAIAFFVQGSSGQKITTINSNGYLGINKFPSVTEEALDVNGNGKFSGHITVNNSTNNSSVQITGYANKGGTGYHDFMSVTNTYSSATNPNKYFRLDSSGSFQIVDSTYNNTLFNLTNAGHTIVRGYVQFGSFSATERAALTPANGMVIYNTTANKFQGYQNGGWINLDTGAAA